MKNFLVSFFTSLLVAAGVSYGVYWFLLKTQWVEVPKLSGATLQEATVVLEKRGLKLIVEEEKSNTLIPKDRIISQQPTPWTEVKKGSTIRIVLSKGSLKVPKLKGLSLSKAKSKLMELGLSTGKIKYKYSYLPANSVISTSPEVGESVKDGSYVDLIVSRGVKLIIVPQLLGKTLTKARKTLISVGLKSGNIYYACDENYRFGVVINQVPRAGKKVNKGTKVDLTINKEEE
ncbi:PASTA domain-containing protein [candidate division WOR-3 bacterium]|nr:PASTA domain-containing protein [candidate division WOR-3 bacterium]